MPISSLLLDVTDVARSVEFYVDHLGAEPREVTADSAVLDAVTATFRLSRVEPGQTSTWQPDDLQAGARHVGFKVADLDARVATLRAAGVPFHLDPIDAEGQVRITFFYDPDGTLLELVEGPLRYHEVYDQAEVDRDWGLGTPTRPRFDHVAETVADLKTTVDYYAPHGFALMGGIHQPQDPRGFDIAYLHGGDSTIEVFTFAVPLTPREARLGAPGLRAVELVGEPTADATVVDATSGATVYADPDGLLHTFRAG